MSASQKISASSISARTPIETLRQMRGEMDRLFNGLFDRTARQPDFQSPLDAMRAWSPAIDVTEKNHCLVVRVDLPGFRKGDVNVDVMEGRLAIWGGLKRENPHTQSDAGRREREYGRFYRAVPLPEGGATAGSGTTTSRTSPNVAFTSSNATR